MGKNPSNMRGIPKKKGIDLHRRSLRGFSVGVCPIY